MAAAVRLCSELARVRAARRGGRLLCVCHHVLVVRVAECTIGAYAGPGSERRAIGDLELESSGLQAQSGGHDL